MSIESLQELLAEYRPRLVGHPLYPRLTRLEDLHVFMRSHVFAVWDFMTLLKALQRHLTCVELPWRPVGDGAARRLINEIVREEESDEGPDGRYLSHFELYCEAMRACGADPGPIEALLAASTADDLPTALTTVPLPPGTARFVGETWDIVSSGSLPAIAAAFTLGREAVIPAMFDQLVERLSAEHDGLGQLVYYLQRHIDLDGDHHGPLAWRMLASLCQRPEDWSAARQAATRALEARLRLWDAIADSLAPVPAGT